MSTHNGYEDLGFAKVDHSRAARSGRAEVIYCPGKTPDEVAAISASIVANNGVLLATRATGEQFAAVYNRLPNAVWHERAGCITHGQSPAMSLAWPVAVLTAGTADLAVADEAAVTLECFGYEVRRFTDCGVAGIHRLFDQLEALRACAVVIVVAGMEGALPSVVAGLIDHPVIAVPTSVGYGANFGGISALLGMLTSCASKVTVVNIDNGFGAASAADAILRLACAQRPGA
jgi:hypothetical protein